MNEASSRSHVVATIAITQNTTTTMLSSEARGGDDKQHTDAAEGGRVQITTKAKLHLVDLAGVMGCDVI